MRNYILPILILICPFLGLSQNVEVIGDLKSNSLDVNTGRVINMADPISPQDAATKAYVDANGGATHAVGFSAAQGGYIFWVSPDGKHGLVAATVDQSLASSWGQASNDISNPTKHSPDGAYFRDWRMPTAYELNEMYLQKASIGGFTDGIYWSATESGGAAHVQYFNLGSLGTLSKGALQKVRAVRAF